MIAVGALVDLGAIGNTVEVRLLGNSSVLSFNVADNTTRHPWWFQPTNLN